MATNKIRGEEPIGTWTILIKDPVVNGMNGSLIDWRITLWGEALDAKKAHLLPLPSNDGDKTLGTDPIHTSTAQVMTTDLPMTTISSNRPEVTENPTDHADRPINSKPGTQTATSGKQARASSLRLSR
jgi:kexin